MSTDLGTAPSHGDNHPIALCLHALIDLARVLHTDPELVTDLDLGAGQDFVAEATRHMSRAKELLDRQERTIEEQNVRIIRADQAWLRVTDANSALNEALNAANTRLASASKGLEQLLITASIDMQHATAFFTEVRKLRETLDPSIALEHASTTRTTGPRLAAGSMK